MEPYLEMKEAMQETELDCWPSDIYKWIERGTLNSDKVGSGRIIWVDDKYEAMKKQRQQRKPVAQEAAQ